MEENEKVYDITIIGGGPIGLFTAFYGGMRQASVKIIESLPQLGGQLSALYPEKYIYDVAGFPKVRAQELVDNLKQQMSKFEPTVVLEEAVQTVEKQADGVFKITTNGGTHFTKAIIITAGNGAFQPRRIELEEAAKYEGKNLHYFIDDLNHFAGKKVVIFGGGDSAVDWALMLEPIAEKVTIVHRRDKFRAHEHSVENLKNQMLKLKPHLSLLNSLVTTKPLHKWSCRVQMVKIRKSSMSMQSSGITVLYPLLDQLKIGDSNFKKYNCCELKNGNEYSRHLRSRRHLYL